MNNIYLNHLLNKIQLKQSELETLNNTISHYGKELDSKFMDILAQNNIDATYVFHQHNTNNTHNTNNYDNNVVIDEYKKLYDSLFKQLSLKSHPDKLNDQVQAHTDFINIKKAYDDKNILELLKYASKYELLTGKLDDLDINLVNVILEKELIKVKDNVNKIRSTVGFQLLIKGDISSYIETIKCNAKSAEENEKFKKKIEEMKEMKEMKNDAYTYTFPFSEKINDT